MATVGVSEAEEEEEEEEEEAAAAAEEVMVVGAVSAVFYKIPCIPLVARFQCALHRDTRYVSQHTFTL